MGVVPVVDANPRSFEMQRSIFARAGLGHDARAAPVPDLDPFSMSEVIQLYSAPGRDEIALEMLPRNCEAAPFRCNDLGVYPEWLPLRGQPAFQALVKKYDTFSQPPTPAAFATSSP